MREFDDEGPRAEGPPVVWAGPELGPALVVVDPSGAAENGLFEVVEHDDLVVDNFVNSIANDHLQIIGSELILGKIYDKIGYPKDGCPDYFRNLVLCRLVYPGSKLKTVEFFRQHLNIEVSVYSVYRFLDELNSKLKPDIERISFDYTKKLLKGDRGCVL